MAVHIHIHRTKDASTFGGKSYNVIHRAAKGKAVAKVLHYPSSDKYLALLEINGRQDEDHDLITESRSEAISWANDILKKYTE